MSGWTLLGLLALSLFSPTASAQDLTLTSTHTGAFQLGQTNAYYLLRVKNAGIAPTSGMVSVVENAPAGLTITSMLGDGWTCTASSCSRSDALAAGAYYPAIMAIASVAQSAGTSLTNKATVSGGGDANAANNAASDVTAVTANGYPVAWGANDWSQSTVPAGISNAVAIAAGNKHSLALRSDGTVVAWGLNGNGQASVPVGLSNVIAIAAGYNHSLALRSDGTVIGWGSNNTSESTAPAGLSGVVSIAAGWYYSLALKSDGTVVAWGESDFNQTAIPVGLIGVTSIAAGERLSLALKSDGTVVAWGTDYAGASTVPPDLSNVVAIAAGMMYGLALKSDGSVVPWGDTANGETQVPQGLSGVNAITASWSHSLALRSDGTVVSWGDNTTAESTVPTSLSGVIAVSAGLSHSLALLSAAPSTLPVTINASFGSPQVALMIVDGATYFVNNSMNYVNSFVLGWTPGSSHTIGTASPLGWGADTQDVFASWSDGGAITHTVSPTSATTYTAAFKRQYRITTAANPPVGGSISPASGFFDAGSQVQFTATPNAGYVFNSFSGTLTITTNPWNWTLLSTMTVTANFIPGGTGDTCTYTINPTHQSFPAIGDVAIIAVTTQSNCTWSARNALSWVILNAPASGTGSGALRFQVLANDGLSRSGTFTVAGQTFTIEQAGTGIGGSRPPRRHPPRPSPRLPVGPQR